MIFFHPPLKKHRASRNAKNLLRFRHRKKHTFSVRSFIRGKTIVWVSVFFFPLFLLVFGWFVFASSLFKITHVEIVGADKTPEEEILAYVTEVLERRKHFLPAHNIFLFDAESIETFLKEEYSRIRAVTVIRVLPDTLRIMIEEREIAAIWCYENSCFYVDRTGTLFEKAPQARGSLLLTIEDMSQGDGDVVGSQVLDEDIMNYLIELKKVLADTRISIGRFRIDSSRRLEGMSDERWVLYLNLENRISPTRVSEILENAFDADPLRELRPHLEYIDLRTPGRIYYK